MFTDGHDGGIAPVGTINRDAAKHDRQNQNNGNDEDQGFRQLFLFCGGRLRSGLLGSHTLLSFAGSTHS